MADGTSICPHCDYIIDASFLSDSSGGQEEPTPAAAPDPRPASRPATRGSGARPAVRPSGARPALKPAAAAPSRGTGVRRSVRPAPPADESTRITDGPILPPRAEPPAEESTRITDGPIAPPSRPTTTARPVSRPRPAAPRAGASAARAAAVRAEPRPEPRRERPEPPAPAPVNTSPAVPRVTSSHRIVSPEEMLADLKHFVLELGQSDKLAFLGAFATVLLSFIPWKTTASEGDILGLVSSGFLVLVAAVITMSAVAVRVRKVMPQLNPVVPWLVQLGSAAFAIVWCFVFISLSWNGQLVPADIGNEMVRISQPAAGVYLAVASGIVSLVGTLMGLKEKPN